ncbi:MAG TPA: hypothetical protein DD429_12090 [Clostridiaceae bacterium]|jgi:uncharacterized protein YybS (DUF2232 family)|nr:hypothetical protein [Clostridiaceae bacterium]
MKKIDTRALVEAAILVAIAAVLIIATWYIPFLSIIGVIIWPIPITILTFKHDLKISIISLVVLFLITAALTDPISTLMLILVYGIPAVVLGFCLRRKYSPFVTIMSMSMSMFVSYIAAIKLSNIIFGTDIMEEFFKLIKDSLETVKNMLRQYGYSEEYINQSGAVKALDPDSLRKVFPGLLALASLIGSYINYYLIGIIFRKLRLKINEVLPLDRWYVSNNLSYGLFFMLLVSWLMVYLKVNSAEIVFNSVFMIFEYTFVIDGLAVASWFLKSRGVPGKVRVFIIIIIMFTPISTLLLFLGIIDYVIDIRKINPSRRRKAPPGE